MDLREGALQGALGGWRSDRAHVGLGRHQDRHGRNGDLRRTGTMAKAKPASAVHVERNECGDDDAGDLVERHEAQDRLG